MKRQLAFSIMLLFLLACQQVFCQELTEVDSLDTEFYSSLIDDELFAKMQEKSYKKNCPVPREDLRLITVLYTNLQKETCRGHMVCHKVIAEKLLTIFKALYEAQYPIEKMVLVDEYDADDEKSMEDNNSSCFNFRFISFTTQVSKHGLGLAVDINTRYNPYVKLVDGVLDIEPANGKPYVDRSGHFDYKIDHEDLCYRLFTEQGFEWGGDWLSCKDYQHFELSDEAIAALHLGY